MQNRAKIQIIYNTQKNSTKKMDHLPSDPVMLLSSINMLLRDDEFDSLEDLCAYFDRDTDEIVRILLDEGYEYNRQKRQFRVM